MFKIIVIAKKEIADSFKSLRILLLILTLSVAMFASVWIGSIGFGVKMRDYNSYLTSLPLLLRSQALETPQLFPLTLLRAGIEYLEILGALLAFLIAYASIARERSNGTNLLLLSRPVSKLQIMFGKLAGLSVLWALVLLANLVTAIIAVISIGNARLTSIDYVRLIITFSIAEIYLLFWTSLALILSGRLQRVTTALFIGISAWVTVVLIFPQIGDTMDPDNQIPGGLFASLGVTKAQELRVLSHFHSFDVIRNGIEVTSITKLFERSAFAFLGIKAKYNQVPIGTVASGISSSLLGILLMISIILILAIYAGHNQKYLGRNK